MENKKQAEILVYEVMSGMSTTEQIGMMNRLLHTALATDLVSGQKKLIGSLEGLSAGFEKVQSAIVEKLETSVETLELEDLFGYYDKLYSYQLRAMDLQRKIVQGKELFPADTLSEEEKAFLNILKSFRTPDEKKSFIDKLRDLQRQADEKPEPEESFDDDSEPEETFDDQE